MSPIQILQKAKNDKYAVGQFNVSTDEQIRAIVEVAKNLNSPIIIGTSEGERKFLGDKQAVALVKSWQEESKLPIILNADHCKSFDSAKLAIDAGYNSIHFDGSELELEESIKITKKVVNYAKNINPSILIEGELGYLRGGAGMHKKIEIKPEDLTKPEQAKKFVQMTNIDSLAIAIGNVHGIVSDKKNPPLYLDRLKEIQKSIPNTLLVLHGGSGTSQEDIKEAIKLGIVKVNINTELRIAYKEKLHETLKKHPEEIKPYKILINSVEAMKKVVEEKIELFGSKNKA